MLPILPQIRFAKAPCKQLSPLRVLVGINHVKDTWCTKLLIPRAFEVTRLDLVDLAKAVEICYCDLTRSDAYDGAVALMQCVDVVNAAASEHLGFQPEMRKFCVQWPRNISERGNVSIVKNLGKLLEGLFSQWRISQEDERREASQRPQSESRPILERRRRKSEMPALQHAADP